IAEKIVEEHAPSQRGYAHVDDAQAKTLPRICRYRKLGRSDEFSSVARVRRRTCYGELELPRRVRREIQSNPEPLAERCGSEALLMTGRASAIRDPRARVCVQVALDNP